LSFPHPQTKFEFFLALHECDRYWEFNLSPSGDWNIYRFDAYRQGMQTEMAFTSLPFQVLPKSDELLLSLDLDLGAIIQPEQVLKVAVSAVIKRKDGELIYWALTHPGPQADFHRRDSFIIELASA
jgi:hypothetical protein